MQRKNKWFRVYPSNNFLDLILTRTRYLGWGRDYVPSNMCHTQLWITKLWLYSCYVGLYLSTFQAFANTDIILYPRQQRLYVKFCSPWMLYLIIWAIVSVLFCVNTQHETVEKLMVNVFPFAKTQFLFCRNNLKEDRYWFYWR